MVSVVLRILRYCSRELCKVRDLIQYAADIFGATHILESLQQLERAGAILKLKQQHYIDLCQNADFDYHATQVEQPTRKFF